MIYAVFLCDDYYLMFIVLWVWAAYRDARYGRTTIIDHAWRLTINVFGASGEDIDQLPYTSVGYVFLVWYSKHPPVAFFKDLDSYLQISSQCTSSHIHWAVLKRRVICSLIFVGKLMALFFHSIASLFMAECACTSLIITFHNDIPSLVCVNPRVLCF